MIPELSVNCSSVLVLSVCVPCLIYYRAAVINEWIRSGNGAPTILPIFQQTHCTSEAKHPSPQRYRPLAANQGLQGELLAHLSHTEPFMLNSPCVIFPFFCHRPEDCGRSARATTCPESLFLPRRVRQYSAAPRETTVASAEDVYISNARMHVKKAGGAERVRLREHAASLRGRDDEGSNKSWSRRWSPKQPRTCDALGGVWNSGWVRGTKS